MAVALFISKLQHRFDSPTKPLVTSSGVTGIGQILVLPQLAYHSINQTVEWAPLNQTWENLNVRLLDFLAQSWTPTAGVTVIGGTTGFLKTGADGFSGAYATGVVGDVGIQGRPQNVFYTTGISLQSGTIGYNFLNPGDTMEHTMVFGQGGILSCWENGAGVATFQWTLGDRGMILKEGDVVKYYVIHADKTIDLIRSTRSKLAVGVPTVPVSLLYHNGAQIDNVFSYLTGYSTSTSQLVSYYGVLDGTYQDWNNPMQMESLAEKTITKDKVEDFTYTSPKKNIQTVSLSLEWREESQYQAFKEFFEHHDFDRPFIFVDKARNKLRRVSSYPLAPNEMFVRFVSAWKDNPLGAGLYGVTVDIREEVDPPVFNAGA